MYPKPSKTGLQAELMYIRSRPLHNRSTPPDIFQGDIKGIGALGHILDYDGSSRATGSFSGSMEKMTEDGDEAIGMSKDRDSGIIGLYSM